MNFRTFHNYSMFWYQFIFSWIISRFSCSMCLFWLFVVRHMNKKSIFLLKFKFEEWWYLMFTADVYSWILSWLHLITWPLGGTNAGPTQDWQEIELGACSLVHALCTSIIWNEMKYSNVYRSKRRANYGEVSWLIEIFSHPSFTILHIIL